ncbi:zinc-dependent metalloprotease [Fulvivirgaceae bacterium BMA10]|uniref:Zinc-dependent metalloprotease n=1 Tax=Splendidivirga corallicola TaxID=3051826 RepID=A0ABT8KU57_9BACT|nr:zinc-dependent metalloprotease [Fulvivirgaceae bacterium BMA10]
MQRVIQIGMCAYLLVLSFNFAMGQASFKSQVAMLSQKDHLKISQLLNNYEVFTLDNSSINRHTKAKKQGISFQLEINKNFTWDLVLEENDVRAPDYRAFRTTENGPVEEPYHACNTYKGHLAGDETLKARLTIDKEQLTGYIHDAKGMVFIEALSRFTHDKAHQDKFVAYWQADIRPNASAECGTQAIKNSIDGIIGESSRQQRAIPGEFNYVIELATDADFEWFQEFGNNSNQEVLGRVNLMEGVYEDHFNLYYLVVFQNVYTTSNDPYDEVISNNGEVINEFRDFWNQNRTNVHRDVAFFFSGKDLRTGLLGTLDLFGEAAGVGVVCTNASNAYAVTDLHANDFNTVAHEIGHLLNSPANHPDGQNCGTPNQTLMCPIGAVAFLDFSNASVTRIGNYLISNTASCLRGLISVVSNHDRICHDRNTQMHLTPASLPNTIRTLKTSSNLTITFSSGSIVNVKATTPSTSNTQWIQATFTHNTTGDVITIRRNQLPTGPASASFGISTTPSCANANQVVTLVANINNVDYNWVVNGGTLLSGQGTQGITARMGNSGAMFVHCTVSNGNDDCGGPAGTSSVLVPNCFTFSTQAGIEVFPNPAKGKITLQSSEQVVSLEIRLIDTMMRERKRLFITKNQTIPISDLKPGVYFLKYSGNGQEWTERIIVQ